MTWDDRPLDVAIDAGAPPEEMRALEDVFERAGLEAEVRDTYLRLSADELPYAMFVLAPVTWIALKFLGGAAEKAGADAWDEYRAGSWKGLRRFLIEASGARANDPRGTVTIRDPTGPDVILRESLPDEALQDLAFLDWEAMSSGKISWDQDEQCWWYLGGGAPRAVRAPRRS